MVIRKNLPYTKDKKFTEKKRKILDKKFEKIKYIKLSNICDKLKTSSSAGIFYYQGILKENYRDIDYIELALIAFECTRMNGGTVKIDRDSGEFEIID